jgi:SAM-dependent methyltransferase
MPYLPEEIAQDIIALYQRHAVSWDRGRSQSLAKRGFVERGWLDRFMALLPPNARVLDIGCGAGEPMARYLIDAGHRVTGVDTSPGMLALCRERWPDGDWRLADMRGLALGETFDGILAWNSFFHLPREDQRTMFPVFARHAAPGAALMFTSGTFDGVGVVIYHGSIMHHASLDPQEYRRLLAGNGFAVDAYAADDPTCGGQTIWLGHSTPSPERSTT